MLNFNLEDNLYNLVKQSDSILPETQAGHLWDFRPLDDNCLRNIISQGTKKPFPEPNCAQELQRFKSVSKLRREFHENVRNHLQISPPKECINRWMFNQLAVPRDISEITIFNEVNDSNDKADDTKDLNEVNDLNDNTMPEPLFRCPSVAVDSKVLHNQLLENLPSTLVIPWSKKKDINYVKSIYKTYISSALGWINKWKDSINDKEELEILYDIEKRLNKLLFTSEDSSNLYDLNGLKERIISLCNSNFFKKRFSEIIDIIVNDITKEAEYIIEEIKNAKVFIEDDEVRVKKNNDSKQFSFTYRGDSLPISGIHYLKLKKLYQIHNLGNDLNKWNKTEKIKLQRALYVLARRYATFFGQDEGAAFHAAAPESSFEVMKNDLGVSQELFASPFNCHFSNYCSAFPDIDCWFGSCGSFFDFVPKSGSFEVGPPYTIEVMDKMAERLDELLDKTNDPLSFIVYVPDWRRPLAKYHEIMENSRYHNGELLMKGHEHAYVVGDQHTSNKRYFSLPFATRVYILQNEKGKEKWNVTKTLLNNLEKSLKKPISMKPKQNSSYGNSDRNSNRNRNSDYSRNYNNRNDSYNRNRRNYNNSRYDNSRNDSRYDNGNNYNRENDYYSNKKRKTNYKTNSPPYKYQKT